jgi:hypothetical protein
MEVIVEIEETIAMSNYKTIRTRICLRNEDGAEGDIDFLGDMAAKHMRARIGRQLKKINRKYLAGGQAAQWGRGRGKKSESV